MKKSAKKLVLSRETLRTLDDSSLKVGGGYLPYQTGKQCLTADSQEISICALCTSPYDTCPDPTIA
ncbi:MAG TPA: hypothetical protein VFR03_17470 [Thermoanaerobaculia bacterium]|nr:hypothetical protein [Thermoanaerobaculia bacterium]